MISSIVKVVRGIIKLRGATDNTQIGNAADGLKTAIQGGDGALVADVLLKNGRKALVTDATVTVEQIFGYDDFADTWFQITRAGNTGDTFRIQIAAGNLDPSTPDSDAPAIDITITLTSTEAGQEINLRDKIVQTLNANNTFNPYFKAAAVKDNAIVHISAKQIGEVGERTGVNAFVITTTGTTTYSLMNSDNNVIRRRGKQNSGVRDPRDKRLVTVGISGEVQAVPGAVGDLFIANALNGSSSADLRVNGSLTPDSTNTFSINSDTDKDIFIEEIRFYGNGNGVQFGKFLSQPTAGGLTNGILVEIRSDEQVTQLPLIKTTDDFKHKFCFGPGAGFQLHIQAGRDDFMASLRFSSTFPIRRSGTFVSGNDYLKVFVRDNLSTGLIQLEFIALGFKKEV
jgi:hypothetical protein